MSRGRRSQDPGMWEVKDNAMNHNVIRNLKLKVVMIYGSEERVLGG